MRVSGRRVSICTKLQVVMSRVKIFARGERFGRTGGVYASMSADECMCARMCA